MHHWHIEEQDLRMSMSTMEEEPRFRLVEGSGSRRDTNWLGILEPPSLQLLLVLGRSAKSSFSSSPSSLACSSPNVDWRRPSITISFMIIIGFQAFYVVCNCWCGFYPLSDLPSLSSSHDHQPGYPMWSYVSRRLSIPRCKSWLTESRSRPALPNLHFNKFPTFSYSDIFIFHDIKAKPRPR